jgi:riboflavin transporter
MVLISQILTVTSIIAIGFFVFKFDKPVIKVKTIVIVSLFVTLSLVLSLISWMVPLFGFPSLKIGISQLPLMLIGFVFGPSWGFIAGLIEDILELLTGTIAFPFFGFTLNKILVGVIPALAFKFVRTNNGFTKQLPNILISIIAISALIYVFSTQRISFPDGDVMITLNMKLIISALILLLVSTLIIGLKFVTKINDQAYLLNWVIAVILVEMIVQLTLTPLWLDIMYDIPFVISVSVRLIKAVFMILVNTLIGHVLLRLITRFFPNIKTN